MLLYNCTIYDRRNLYFMFIQLKCLVGPVIRLFKSTFVETNPLPAIWMPAAKLFFIDVEFCAVIGEDGAD